jgi:hypothetical protein
MKCCSAASVSVLLSSSLLLLPLLLLLSTQEAQGLDFNITAGRKTLSGKKRKFSTFLEHHAMLLLAMILM